MNSLADDLWTPPPCKHLNLVPHTFQAGKVTWPKGGDRWIMDWQSNIINAHQLRVTQYYCPECGQLIPAPTHTIDQI